MGKNIDKIEETKIILNTIKKNFFVVYWRTLMNVRTIPLVRKLMGRNKNRRFLKRVPWFVLCQGHAKGLVITLGHTGCCTWST